MSALDHAQAGQKFGPYEFSIPAKRAAAYAAAIGNPGSPEYGGGLPPLAVVAAGLSRLIEELGLAGGTVHAGQEAEFLRQVQPDEKLTARAELKAISVRRDNRFATIATEFLNDDGEIVATSSSTIIVAA